MEVVWYEAEVATLLALCSDGARLLIDLARNKIRRLPVRESLDASMHATHLSRDGRICVKGIQDSGFRVLGLAEPHSHHDVDAELGDFDAVALSPRGDSIAIIRHEGALSLRSTRDGLLLWRCRPQPNHVTALRALQGSPGFVFGTILGSAGTVLHGKDGTEIEHHAFAATVHDIVASVLGVPHLAASDDQGRIEVIRRAGDPAVVKRFQPAHFGSVLDMAHSGDRFVFALRGSDRVGGILELETGEFTQNLWGVSRVPLVFRWSPDDKWILGIGQDGIAYIWNSHTGGLYTRLPPHVDAGTRRSGTEEGAMALVVGGNPTVINPPALPKTRSRWLDVMNYSMRRSNPEHNQAFDWLKMLRRELDAEEFDPTRSLSYADNLLHNMGMDYGARTLLDSSIRDKEALGVLIDRIQGTDVPRELQAASIQMLTRMYARKIATSRAGNENDQEKNGE